VAVAALNQAWSAVYITSLVTAPVRDQTSLSLAALQCCSVYRSAYFPCETDSDVMHLDFLKASHLPSSKIHYAVKYITLHAQHKMVINTGKQHS